MNDITPATASQASSLVAEASAFVVTTNEQLQDAGALLRTVKQMRKTIETETGPAVTAAHAAWKAMIALRDKYDKPLEQAEMKLKQVSAKFLQDQERARLAEQQRLEALARAEEEKKRKAEVRALKKSGDTAAATSLAAAPLPPVIVAPPVAVPKVEGVQTRKTYCFEVLDAALVPREYLMVDEQKIRRYLNAMGEAAIAKGIPGCRLWVGTSLAVRA